MKIKTILPLIILAAITLSGCATVSESQCRVGDWQTLGKEAGFNGADQSRFFDNSKDCANYGIRGNAADFETGRQQGLKHYCTSNGGLNAGRRGYEYKGVCSGPAELEFMRGYLTGRELYLLELEYNDRYRRFNNYRHDYYGCNPRYNDCGYYHNHMSHEQLRLRELRMEIDHKNSGATIRAVNK